jgi:chromosome condensin MukBEF ATPase and DNA-binding subunit MukB
MLRLEEGPLGHTLRANGTAFNQQEELRRLTHDIADLKRRISDQITLIQELAWEAQDTVSVKEALNEMQETLRDWYAHRDLHLNLPAFSISSGFFGRVAP